MSLKQITLEQLLQMFDPEVHDTIQRLAQSEDTTGLVVFENLQMDSSQFSNRTAMVVGPTRTYKTVEACEGQHLYDLPSQRQYATCYWSKGE
jgi:hypothetical protein